MGFLNIVTLLNSGYIIFEGVDRNIAELETFLEDVLLEKFGFPIPVVVRSDQQIQKLYEQDPFSKIEVTNNTRLYVSFLKEKPTVKIELPWKTEDQSFTLLDVIDLTVVSVLDISKNKTPKGMDDLEKLFVKKITTRNWNTVERIYKKLN